MSDRPETHRTRSPGASSADPPERDRSGSHETNRKAVGARGEGVVEQALRARGFQILARNQRTRFGELDIIAASGAQLWFVEVKTRLGRRDIPVEISRQQRHRLTRMAYRFLQRNGEHWAQLQFVVVVVRPSAQGVSLEWIEQAFDGTY